LAGIGIMHRLIMDEPLFGDIITILGISPLTIILFTVPIVGVIEIRIGIVGTTNILTGETGITTEEFTEIRLFIAG
jgi:uncharacterized metal-binding protein